MHISVENFYKKIPINLILVSKIAKKILRYEGKSKGGLSIVFVADTKIKALNKKFLKKGQPTDVLAFDYSEDSYCRGKNIFLGEIIISSQAALRQAKIFKTNLSHEIVLYVIHGILHLVGYDDHDTREIQKMRQREKKLIQRVDKDISGVVEK